MSQIRGRSSGESDRTIIDPDRSGTWWNLLTLGALLLIGLFHLSRLSPVHGWSDDGSVYLRYAQNLLDGRPYHEVAYGQTAAADTPLPRYPLVLPLLLAPLVRWQGLDYATFKVLMLLLFLGSAAMAAWSLRSLTGPLIALGSCVWVAGAYPLWVQADHINSDFLFLLIVSAYFTVAERLESANVRNPVMTHAAVHTFFIVAATSTRTVGFTLIPALLFYSLWKHRRLTREAVVTALVSTLAVGALGARSGGGYAGHLANAISLGTFRRNVIQYPLAMGEVFDQGIVLGGVLDVLAVFGAFILIRRAPHRWAAFAVPYAATLLLWPYSDPVRFLIPLLPWLFAGILEAVSAISRWLPRPSVWVPLAIAVQLLSQAPHYLAPRAAEEGLNSPAALETYVFLKGHLGGEAAVACRKPRTVALLAGRKAIAYAPLPAGRMGPDLCGAGVTHVLTAPNLFPDDAAYLQPFIQHGQDQLDLLYHNAQFTLYQFRPGACGAWTGRRKDD